MKALKIVVLLVLTLALMGCFESIVLLRVNKDGSGTIEETIVISDAFMELMKSFGGEEEGEAEEQEPIDEQELIDKAAGMGEGVQYVSAEPVKTDRGSGYKAIYSFSDINDVRINQNPGENVSPPPMGGEEEGPVEEWLRFNFSGGRTATLEIIYPQDLEEEMGQEESAEGEVDMDSNPEMMDMMRELYRDMHFGIAVEVDGQIVETNASYVDGSTVTLMDIDFAKILEDEEKFQELMSANPETVEEMKELVKDNPGIKVEIEEAIRIRFR
jgi:hypothetical protein